MEPTKILFFLCASSLWNLNSYLQDGSRKMLVHHQHSRKESEFPEWLPIKMNIVYFFHVILVGLKNILKTYTYHVVSLLEMDIGVLPGEFI